MNRSTKHFANPDFLGSLLGRKSRQSEQTQARNQNGNTGKEVEYTLVSEEEADPLENKISTASPIGGAIVNEKAGAVVEVETPRGLVKYKILEIK